MCGIAGFYLKDPTFLDKAGKEGLLDELLLGIEHRGTDATGYVAASAGGKVVELKKDDIPATYFVQMRDWLPKDLRMVLGHTRMATQGKPENNENNHPVNFKSCFATHNGVIYNDRSIIDETGVERVAEVDSIAVPMLVSHCGFDKALEHLPKLQGSWALAIADPVTNPDELLLVRGSSSPLIVLDLPKIIVWASTVKTIEDAWAKAIGTVPSQDKFDWMQEGEALTVDKDGGTQILTFMEPKPMYSSYSSTNAWWGEDDTKEFVRGPARGTPPASNKVMCFECGEKVSYFTVVDAMVEGERTVEWDVPVCYDCKEAINKDNKELTYRFATVDAQVKLRVRYMNDKCELCMKEASVGFNSIGAKLCQRCLDTEPTPYATFKGGEDEAFLKLNPGDVIPMKMRKAFHGGCESCGSNVVAYIGDDGLPICGVCRMAEEGIGENVSKRQYDQCEGCQVYFQRGQLTNCISGALCKDCMAAADEDPTEDPDACGVKVVKEEGKPNFLPYLREAEELHASCDASSVEREVAAAMSLHIPFVMWLTRTCSQDHLDDTALHPVYDEVVGRVAEAERGIG